MWILFAILTVLLWGTSETIFKSVSNNEKNTVLKLIACNGIMMGIVALFYAPIVIFVKKEPFDIQALLTYLPVAAVYITSMFCTYKAMRYIKVSIMSPIQNASCAIVTILCVVVLKQALAWYQILAIVLVVVGLILLSINKDETLRLDMPEGEERISKAAAYKLYLTGFAFALGYFLLDGIGGFMDEALLDISLSEEQLLIAYSVLYFIVGFISYIYLKATKKITKLYDIKNDKKKILGTLIETAGQYTYIYAFAFGAASIASPFVAAYSVVTIILSRIFLKEKLKVRQYAMIVLVMVGLVLLSIETEDEVDAAEIEEANENIVVEQIQEDQEVEEKETILDEYVVE